MIDSSKQWTAHDSRSMKKPDSEPKNNFSCHSRRGHRNLLMSLLKPSRHFDLSSRRRRALSCLRAFFSTTGTNWAIHLLR